MKFILGKKLQMTQVFDNEGNVHPATIVANAGPLVVTQVKDAKKDGYSAVQIGYGDEKATHIGKAKKGHLKNLGEFKHLREFRLGAGDAAPALGDKIDVTTFKEGDVVVVTAVSKGKGFQGVVKRHGFKGGPRSHGQKHSEREPGSISGGNRNGGRVPKNMRMAGRMGGDRITVKNLKVLYVNPETREIYIKGAIPGKRGTLVEIKG
jgi:large subunit ribosomal protein L3